MTATTVPAVVAAPSAFTEKAVDTSSRKTINSLSEKAANGGVSGVKKNALIWRELVDAAVMRQERRWDSIDDLAFRAGVLSSTAYYGLRRLIDVGAIRQHHAGFTVVNPAKVLTFLCAARSITADALASVTMDEREIGEVQLAMDGALIPGGAEAAVELLGGVNTVSDYSDRIFYVRGEDASGYLVETLKKMDVKQHFDRTRSRGNVSFITADARAARNWLRHTSFGQTYADLFATPGWQASEFRLALHDRFLGERDWDQS